MKNTISILSVISVVLLFVTGCSPQYVTAEATTESSKSVETQKIEMNRTEEILDYTGSVNLVDQINIASKYGGKLVESFVIEGDLVEEGQLVAVLDTSDLSLQISSMWAKMATVQKEIDVKKVSIDYYVNEQEKLGLLYEEGIITKSEVDKMNFLVKTNQLNYEASLANYNQLATEKNRLSAMIKEGNVYSTSVGVVDKVYAETSEFVSPTQPIYTLSLNGQEVTTYVTGKDINRLQVGGKVYLMVDGEPSLGIVKSIDDSADSMTHSFKVAISVDDSKHAPGTVVGIGFVVGQIDGIWIPLQSIQSTTIDFVYGVKDNRATRRSVQIIEIKGDEVLVEGLEVDDYIVVSGMKSLLEGMLVDDGEMKVD